MARARGSTSSGYAVALVFFGAGFVICLLLAIIFYTQIGEARNKAKEATSSLNTFANANEQVNPKYKNLAGGNKTVVGALADQNHTLKNMISGDGDATIATIQNKMNQLGVNGALTRRIKTLQATLADAKKATQQAKQVAASQKQRVQVLQQQQSKLQSSYDRSRQELKQQIDKMKKAFAQYQGQGKQIATTASQKLNKVRNEDAQKIAKLQQNAQQLQGKINQLKKLLDQVGHGPSLPKITQPDGKITTVASNGSRVYINRGSDDRVILGMTFEVFSPGQLVKLDKAGAAKEARGKATIEIMGLQAHSALARVVRQEQGANVQPDDEIVNLVYDPNAVYKFFVYGDFNIDHARKAQPGDEKRIESMINRWGGKVADKLSYDTDFLVLGAEPPLPQKLPEGTINPKKIKAYTAAKKKYTTYQTLVGKAKSLHIPILNQNRFLTLVGYYQR